MPGFLCQTKYNPGNITSLIGKIGSKFYIYRLSNEHTGKIYITVDILGSFITKRMVPGKQCIGQGNHQSDTNQSRRYFSMGKFL